MRIRYDNVPDPLRVRIGDLLILPKEDPDKRKTRLSASSIARLGVSIGNTCRSDNRYEDVQHIIFERCDLPLVLEVRETGPARAAGYYGSAAWRIRANRNLLCNDNESGDVVGSVALHYVNMTLDDRFYPVRESRYERPNEFFGCNMYKELVSEKLGYILTPSIVMSSDSDPQDDVASIILSHVDYSVAPIVPASTNGVIEAVRHFSESTGNPNLGSSAARTCIVNRYIGGTDKVMRADVSFLSAMIQRGAKLVRPVDGSWRAAYVKRIAERILLRVKENELKVESILADYRKRLATGGRTAVSRSREATAATRKLRFSAGERRALDAFAEGK